MRRSVFRAPGLIALAGLLASGAALAHDTWIQARETAIAVGGVARFDVTSGDQFAVLDHAIAPDRIAREGLRIGGATETFTGRTREKAALLLTRAIAKDGVAAAWLELKPRTLELAPDKVAEYLEDIGQQDTIGKAIAGAPPRRWRETYRKHAKTFVRVGSPAESDGSWREPVGMALEIIPDRDPTALRAGDVLPVRILHDGQPLEGFSLVATPDGSKERRITRTDAKGRATVSLDRAGRWLLAGTRLVPGHKANVEWESDFTTLTVSVLEAAAPARTPRPAALVPDQPFVGTPRPPGAAFQEILRLKEAGKSDAELLARVEREGVFYALTTPQIQQLRAAGAGPQLIEAMLRSGRAPAPPTPR